MKRPGWMAWSVVAMVALAAVVVLGSAMTRQPGPGVSPRVQVLIDQMQSPAP